MKHIFKFNVIACILVLPLFMDSVETKASDELTLSHAYKIALNNNEEITVSEQELESAKDGVIIARSQLYPQITLQGDYSNQKKLTQQFSLGPGATSTSTFQNPNIRNYTIQLQSHIYHGGKPSYLEEVQQKQSLAEKNRHYRRLQEILFNVAQSYFGVLLARRNLEISKNNYERANNQLERANGRFDVGEITKTAVLRAEVQIAEAEEGIQRADNELDVAREQLALALGMDTTPQTIKKAKFNDFPDSGLKDFYKLAMQNRRDLKQTEFLIKASNARLKSEKSDFYPNIDLVSQYTDSSKGRFSDEKNNWSIQFVGSYPIFSGWRETSEIDQAQSSLTSARARYDRLKKQIRVQIREVYLNLDTQRNVINTISGQVESARKNYNKITAEFEQGLTSAVDVSDALNSLQQAESRLAQARYNFQLDLLRLKLVTGTFQNSRLNEYLTYETGPRLR